MLSLHIMNPHEKPLISPPAALHSFIFHRSLIYSLAKREVLGRYQGSVFGLLWSFLNPLFMLAVYTFVFSVVFKARWHTGGDSKAEFALVLFSGLIVFNLFAECFNRAPNLVLSNVNYVKKVIFPLEILPYVSLGSALFHMLISLIVWIIFYSVFFGFPKTSIMFLPIMLFPLMLLTLGLSWFLSSVGVFLRDMSQVTGLFTTVLMFLSPVFYPVSSIPDQYRMYIFINPLALVIEQARNVMILNQPINWLAWTLLAAVSSATFWLGFVWFQKTRKDFADVL